MEAASASAMSSTAALGPIGGHAVEIADLPSVPSGEDGVDDPSNAWYRDRVPDRTAWTADALPAVNMSETPSDRVVTPPN
ncbi:hypothetical protein AB0323_03300 [Arthrobacter sp. NPDC080031]|uniref:hypothetical protein n=1 Tax=Arthrobacter sp. NPDC080031 TaxID=3155918 RepID=UPI0034510BAC